MYFTQQNFDNLSAIFKRHFYILSSLVLIFSFSAIYIKIIHIMYLSGSSLLHYTHSQLHYKLSFIIQHTKLKPNFPTAVTLLSNRACDCSKQMDHKGLQNLFHPQIVRSPLRIQSIHAVVYVTWQTYARTKQFLSVEN